MHPDPAFRIDAAACRVVAECVAFAHIFVHGPRGSAVVHAPCVLAAPDRLTFHLARRNHAYPLLEDARALASFVATEGYVSPDWYKTHGQVPTWNYLAAEAEGTLVPLSREALIEQIDALGAVHEGRLAPKPAWTRDKVPHDRFEAMLNGIAGFALEVAAWRGTAKLSQNKPAPDVAGTIRGLRAAGRNDLANSIAARAR